MNSLVKEASYSGYDCLPFCNKKIVLMYYVYLVINELKIPHSFT